MNKTKFKQTEIGEIPEDWQQTTLGEVSSDISYGYTASASDIPIGPKFLRITDIQGGYVDWHSVPYCQISDKDKEKYQLNHGDVCIARTGASTGTNYTVKNKVDAVFASYLIRYKINSTIADPFYVGLLLKSPKWKDFVSSIIGGSAQPGANAKQFASFEFLLPSLPEQRAIAKILSDLDEKIELNHQMNKTLESIAQTFFKRWFIEKEGNAKRIAVADIIEFDPRILAKKGDTLPYVDMKELSTEGMTVGAVILKSFSGGARFQNGDTLLARITPCLENGKTAFVSFLTDKGRIGFGSTEFIVMRAKEGISPQFVYCLARDSEFRSFAIKSMVGSSGRQRVQRNMLERYEIFKPDQESMSNFHKATFPLFSKVIENWKETRVLMQIRDSLLPRLMSGKTRVN